MLTADVWLHIISFLDLASVLNLSISCHRLHNICHSNYVWGLRLFAENQALRHDIMHIIYRNNRAYFTDYFVFSNYVKLDYHLDGNPEDYNYLELFRNIIMLISDLRAPYHHEEITNCVQQLYDAPNGHFSKCLYTIRATHDLARYVAIAQHDAIWYSHQDTPYSEILIWIQITPNRILRIRKVVQPRYVPASIIKKSKVILYRETICRVFCRKIE